MTSSVLRCGTLPTMSALSNLLPLRLPSPYLGVTWCDVTPRDLTSLHLLQRQTIRSNQLNRQPTSFTKGLKFALAVLGGKVTEVPNCTSLFRTLLTQVGRPQTNICTSLSLPCVLLGGFLNLISPRSYKQSYLTFIVDLHSCGCTRL